MLTSSGAEGGRAVATATTEAAGAGVRAVDSVDRPVDTRVVRLLDACPRCGEERMTGRNELGGWCDVCGSSWP